MKIIDRVTEYTWLTLAQTEKSGYCLYDRSVTGVFKNGFQNFVEFFSPNFSTNLIDVKSFFLLKHAFKTKTSGCLKKLDNCFVVNEVTSPKFSTKRLF